MGRLPPGVALAEPRRRGRVRGFLGQNQLARTGDGRSYPITPSNAERVALPKNANRHSLGVMSTMNTALPSTLREFVG